jgi:hypothetical protein
MKPKDMQSIAHRGNHAVAPKPWREVPCVTGDYDIDGTIAHCGNSDMPARLNLYVTRRGTAYGPRTGYGGYRGYSGDG